MLTACGGADGGTDGGHGGGCRHASTAVVGVAGGCPGTSGEVCQIRVRARLTARCVDQLALGGLMTAPLTWRQWPVNFLAVPYRVHPLQSVGVRVRSEQVKVFARGDPEDVTTPTVGRLCCHLAVGIERDVGKAAA